jgi:hypothetical protein
VRSPALTLGDFPGLGLTPGDGRFHGSSFPLIQNRADDLDRFEFLAKPFHFHGLLHKVRVMLDITAPLLIRRRLRE